MVTSVGILTAVLVVLCVRVHGLSVGKKLLSPSLSKSEWYHAGNVAYFIALQVRYSAVVCVCVRERERVSVRVSVSVIVRERESECDCECECDSERESVCV
jgi:hypothetical protein